MLVTSRSFFDFAVGDLYEPSFATITGKGDNSMYAIHFILHVGGSFRSQKAFLFTGNSDFHLRFATSHHAHQQPSMVVFGGI